MSTPAGATQAQTAAAQAHAEAVAAVAKATLVRNQAVASGADVSGVPVIPPVAATPRAATGLTAEAQHVINSLEAHFQALVKLAQTGGVPAVVAEVQTAWEEVSDRLEAWGQQFAQDAEVVAAGVKGLSAAKPGTPANPPSGNTTSGSPPKTT